MQLPDVNVLICARRQDAPEHDRYAAGLRSMVDAPEPFAVAEIVLAGFLRIVTNPKIFRPATPMQTALAFCRGLVEWPRAVLIMPSRAHWDHFVSRCADVEGRLVADAYVAALASEHGCELVTTDGDFARFKGLRWRHPFAAQRCLHESERERAKSRASSGHSIANGDVVRASTASSGRKWLLAS